METKEKFELSAQHGWREYDREELIEILREFWDKFRKYSKLLHTLQKENPKEVIDVGCGVVSVVNLLVEDMQATKFYRH